jgi:DNA repair exonuclease SbcCD ATPase subunit
MESVQPRMNLTWKAALTIFAGGAVVLIAQSTHAREHTSSHTSGNDDQCYVIVSGDNVTMNGSSSDERRALMLRDRVAGDYIFIERDLKFYYIVDPVVVGRAKKLFRPQQELGRKQEELGERQAKLGEEQARLGEEQARISVQGNLGNQMENLKRQIETLQTQAAEHHEYTQEDLGNLQGKIGDLQGRIGDLQGQAGEEQGELGEKQGKLGERQGKLGEEQGKLGEEQGRLAEIASGKMKQLIDQAIRDGLAKPVQ